MMRRSVRGSMVSSLFLIVVLFAGCWSASACPNEGNLTARQNIVKTIVTPNYPDHYFNSRICGWTITTTNTYEVVRLMVVSLNLEDGAGCPYDSLSIYDADGPRYDRRLAKLCGTVDQWQRFSSTGRHMHIQFVSDGADIHRGFRLLYTAVRRSEVVTGTSTTPGHGVSGQRFVKAQRYGFSYLMSPSYPYSYYSHESILWNIVCDPGYVVRLHVVEMDLQSSRPCGENRVTVYDSDNTTLLATMCNKQSDGLHLRSTGWALHVHFTSGIARAGRGFSLGFRAVTSSAFKSRTARDTERRPRPNGSTTPSPDRDSSIDGGQLLAIVVSSVLFAFFVCVILGLLHIHQRSRPRLLHPAAPT